MTFILSFITIYFTNFPYVLYKDSSNNGNMAFAGIALGFIHSQQIFWGANTILLTTIYLNEYFNIYSLYSIFLLCIFLYGISFVKIYDLCKYIE